MPRATLGKVTGDQRWALYLTAPALVASIPFYLASVAYYYWCREGFADFLDFIEHCEGLPHRGAEQDAA